METSGHPGLVNASVSDHHDDDHHDDDHHDEDHHDDDHHGEIIRHFQTWVQVTSLILLSVALVVGSLGNSFGLYVSIKKKDAPSNRVSYVVLFLVNLVTVVICLPMVITGLMKPHVLGDAFCYVQETLTFFTSCINTIIPAFWALETFDKVARYTRRWLTRRRSNGIVAAIVLLVLVCCVLPIFTITTTGVIHEHGCHWWTTMVDAYVWYQFIIVAALLGPSTMVQIVAYSLVLCRARRHEQNFTRNRNRIVPGSSEISGPGTVNATVSGVRDEVNSRAPLGRQDSHTTLQQSNSPLTEKKILADKTTGQKRSKPAESEDRRNLPPSIQTRVATMSVFIIGIYALCSFPWLILNALVYSGSEAIDPQLRIFTMALVYLTSAALPIVIIVIAREHRKVLGLLISRLLPSSCRS